MISGIDYGKGNDESCTITFVSPEYIKRLEKENKQLKEQLHQCSLEIQELNERDLFCPSSCEKLDLYKNVVDEVRQTITSSKDYQIIKAMKLTSEQSLWIKTLEILDKVKKDSNMLGDK